MPSSEPQRSIERLHSHYLIERELADKLRAADRDERARLYGDIYDELFRRVPDHPQLTAKVDPATRARDIERQARLVERYAPPGATIMEIGAGDCALSDRLSRRAGRVIAVDVSNVVTEAEARPDNVELRLIDGCSIPATPTSVDVAYSNQLLEHLHPEDAEAQARDVLHALRPGGVYICITPSRLTGPHDISSLYDEQATGFHLKEYSTAEAIALFRGAGFARVRALTIVRGHVLTFPASPLALVERVLDALPRGLGRKIARHTPLRKILGGTVAYAP